MVPSLLRTWQIGLSLSGCLRTTQAINGTTSVLLLLDSFIWKEYIVANRQFLLSCVFSVVRAYYYNQGMPTTTAQHDFAEAIQSLDYIVTEMFNLAPLLEGNRMEVDRMTRACL